MEKYHMKICFSGVDRSNGGIENLVSFSFCMFVQERCQCMNTVDRDCSIFDIDGFGVLGTFEKCDFMGFFEMSSYGFKMLIGMIMITNNSKLRILRQSTEKMWSDIEKILF